MVDFNTDATVSSPAANLVKILLLQARANALEALEFLNKKESSGVQFEQAMIKARLGTWFLEHQAYLERTMPTKDYKELYNKFTSKLFFSTTDLEKDEVLDLFIFLNKIMDKLRITKVDTKAVYDRSNIEEDNFHNDLG